MSALHTLTVAEVVRRLDLAPHPEGGWYRETFRDTHAPDGRPASTAIYYVLARDQRSHWHRVIDAVEVWHFHAGAPLILSLADNHGRRQPDFLLGPDITLHERPQVIVPAGWWQAAESQGDWTLVGCTVAPGFQFSSFEMAPKDWIPL